jgi:hypothetical protein
MNKDDKTLETQIELMMEQLTIEKAPASLSLRLNRIPEEENRKERLKEGRWSWLKPGSFPRWALVPAFAAVPLLVAVVMLMQPRQPSPVEVELARQQVALAFAYLDKVGYRTGTEIKNVLGTELRHSVKDPLSEHMPFTTKQPLKEETT